MTPSRDDLHSILRSSLNDVLVDLGIDKNRNGQTGIPQSSLSLPPAQLYSGARRVFESPSLPSQPRSPFSQSHGHASSSLASMRAGLTLQTAASGLGLTPDDILLAAAAASQRSNLLEQAKASLIQQQNAEEYRRLLLQKSYFSLLQEGAGYQSQALLPQQLVQHTLQAAPARVLGEEALEALGTNLRAKSDPYIDVSSVADPNPEDATFRRTRGGVAEPFPEKLHRMLSDVEKDGISDVVSFFSHGRAFGVHDMDKFVSEVMPKYFKQTKWHSFARQLNLYGFIRITSGPDAGGYYHELFLRGRPNLCLHMRRVGVPQEGEDRRKFRPKNKIIEPDFYSMGRIELEEKKKSDVAKCPVRFIGWPQRTQVSRAQI